MTTFVPLAIFWFFKFIFLFCVICLFRGAILGDWVSVVVLAVVLAGRDTFNVWMEDGKETAEEDEIVRLRTKLFGKGT
jgi:hypothetical protein